MMLFTQAPRVFGAYFYSGELQCARNRAVLRARLLPELSSGVTLQYTLPICNHLTHALLMSTHVPHRPLLPPSCPFPPPSNPPSRQVKSTEKCIWNAAHPHALVIVTANVGPSPSQRINIDIIDSTPQCNVYLSRTSTPKHASRPLLKLRAGLACALKTIWPQVCPLSSVGLWVDREYRCQDGDCTEHDAHN